MEETNQSGELVSIGLPVRNGEPYVAEALHFLLAQQYEPLEIILCDNASTDRTWEILQASASDPRVCVHRSEIDLGAVANFSTAFRLSRGAYFAWAAADDHVTPTFISRCLDALRADPEAAGCLTGVCFIDETGDTIRVRAPSPEGAAAQLRGRLRWYLSLERWNESYALFRRSALQESCPLPQGYGWDVKLVWRILLDHHLTVVEDPLLDYREYTVKTVETINAGLYPVGSAPRARYSYLGMWRGLWAIAGEHKDPRTRRVAHQELLVCLRVPPWRGRLVHDVELELRRHQHSLDDSGSRRRRVVTISRIGGLYLLIAAIDPPAFWNRASQWLARRRVQRASLRCR